MQNGAISRSRLDIDGLRFGLVIPRFYSDSTYIVVSRCGDSGDSRPAIMAIVRFAIPDSVPLRPSLRFQRRRSDDKNNC